jgi:hypothetical protein
LSSTALPFLNLTEVRAEQDDVLRQMAGRRPDFDQVRSGIGERDIISAVLPHLH